MGDTINFINKLFDLDKTTCIELNGKCQICKKPVRLIIFKDDPESTLGNGGVAYKAPGPLEFKCTECLKKDNGNISPQHNEVFARVCGYLRPVNAFNPGKKEEFKSRVNYKL